MSDDQNKRVKVSIKYGDSGYQSEIISGNHVLIADEPIVLGGENKGPGPYEYLLSALGACTAMTLKMYAKLKEWNFESIEVELSHNKVYKDDCVNCDDPNAKIDYIKRDIKITGNLDDKQRERLLQIANKCPVHKTLHSEIKVDSQLVN